MISIFKSVNTVFVYCPGNTVTGGPELLHQLVEELNKNHIEAYIVYYPVDRIYKTPIPYLRYGCPVSTAIRDSPNAAVITPEVATSLLRSVKKAVRVIWWLSVDNYLGNWETRGMMKRYIRRLFERKLPESRKIIHLCQSWYAKEFVKRYFYTSGWMLSDYLADEFLSQPNTSNKTDEILFNPKKGGKFTQRVIDKGMDCNFIPLISLTREEMRDTMRRAKIYIDLGAHPGKDRIPREAAMCGCVIIVGMRGSAMNDIDVPIPNSYKLRPNDSKNILIRIHDILTNYEYHFAAQAHYRKMIQNERAEFQTQVRSIFCSEEILSKN